MPPRLPAWRGGEWLRPALGAPGYTGRRGARGAAG
jgi:hypothetical protein